MPLRLFPPKAGRTPNWRVRGTYLGQHVNRSTGTRKRAVAVQALRKIEREIESGEFSQRGEATFADAALAYMQAGGERRYIKKLLEYFGDVRLSRIDQQAIDAAALTLYPSATPATRNRQVYTVASAILRRAGFRLDLRRPIGAGGEQRIIWLWPEQFFALLAEAEKINQEFAALLTVLCYTGLRLSEALRLTWNEIRLDEGYAYVPVTKNADPRGVFLPPVAVAALANLNKDRERVFRFARSRHLYRRLALSAARAGIDLPERHGFHILRHTYATWLRRFAGLDTRGLVATGAWKDRRSAERYEHTIVTEEARKAALLPTPTGARSVREG